MEKKLKNLIIKKQKFYNIGISNSDIGTKYGTIEIFSDGIGHIIFKWENSNDFSAFLLSKHVKHHLPMSFDENTICEEINNGVFSFDGGNDWKIIL